MASVTAALATARHWPRFTQRLMWVAVCFVVSVAPHLSDLSPSLAVLAAATVLWRLTIELRQWRMPGKWIRIGVAIAGMLTVLATYRTLNGIEAGTALLVVMGSMKLLETQTQRDLTIVVFVAFFLLFAGFLYDQQLLLLPYMLAATWLSAVTLMRIHQTEPMSTGEAAVATGRMFLQALPLAAILFVFFPRLPGQFWAVPAKERGATGIDDEMSPGDVSELSISEEIAFRVKFADDEVPPQPERYWRGPVLHDFDGRTWRRPQTAYVPQPVVPTAPPYRYRLVLEPHNRTWVFALDAPTKWPRRTRRTADLQLLANRNVSTLTTFDLESTTAYRIDAPLSRSMRAADLRLPENRNPRTIQLAQQLLARAGSESAFVTAVLTKFREEEYIYTLEPPRLESDSVDDFLFNTRRGFCEHFASAFTTLARAAGIPARVVTGYQGGELNPLNGYIVVRQSNAHAWSEVWLEGQGWVRIDPTAAVAPERIERGLEAAISDEEAVPGRIFARSTLLAHMRNAWDAVNTFWNDYVVEFDQDQQRSILARLGIEDADWEALGIALVVATTIFFAVLTLYLGIRYRPPRRDPLVEAYETLCKRLARRDLSRASYEGPNDYLTRVARARPDLASQLNEVRSIYVGLRYGPTPLASQLSRLKFLVNQLRV